MKLELGPGQLGGVLHHASCAKNVALPPFPCVLRQMRGTATVPVLLMRDARFEGVDELIERFFEVGALRGDVDADEPVTIRAEHVAEAEPQAGLVLHESLELVAEQPQAPAVDPREVGALALHKVNTALVRAQPLFEQRPVALEVVLELREPFAAMLVGGLGRHQPERVGLAVAGCGGVLEPGAYVRVGDDDVGRLQPRQVEGLAGARADDGVLERLLP